MEQHPLGILRSGPRAFADERGTVAPWGADWTVRWWVAGEDRWHRPDVDAGVRQRLIDDTPVVETAVRVPGGDAVGLAYGFAAGGDPVVAGRVSNASPVPVAVALVVGPARSVAIDGSTVVIDGHQVIHLSRRPSASTSAADLDGLAEALPGATTVQAQLSGYAAVVVPLPHTQAVSWHLLDAGLDGADPTLVVMPEPDQVAAGWIRHSAEGAQLLLAGPSATAFTRDRHIVAMGVTTEGPLLDVADQVGAAVRLGWFDAALDGTERLALAQRGRGRIGDDESSTAAALDGLASWRRAGIPAHDLEHLLGPVVSASRWLAKRRGRLDGSAGPTVDASLRSAAAFLMAMDQTDIVDHLRSVVGSTNEPNMPDDAEAVQSQSPRRRVSAQVDALVADDLDGLVILDGWSTRSGREPIEADGVPTPWGTASFALRWHGARPALLWEVEPWPDVTRPEPQLRCPRLDPAWRGSGWRGDALLAEPAGLDRPMSVTDESFS
jgi:hypothetical protein